MEMAWKYLHGLNDNCWLFTGDGKRKGALFGIDTGLGCAVCAPFVVCVELLVDPKLLSDQFQESCLSVYHTASPLRVTLPNCVTNPVFVGSGYNSIEKRDLGH